MAARPRPRQPPPGEYWILERDQLQVLVSPLRTDMAVDFRNIQFSEMFPTLDTKRLSAGRVGAQLQLKGTGQSVAEFLGSSSGSLAAAMSGGRVSHTVMAAASLNGGKLIPLLLKGDEPLGVRCAAVSMAVDKGVARTQLLVFDTEQVRVDGNGALDLANEQFELELKANESTYIPIGNKHRLGNSGTVPLVIIEVQCGEYVEEDDIVRFDDVYGRVKAVPDPAAGS